MAQAAHAATAVLAEHKDLPDVTSYLADLGNMRKVVMEVSPLTYSTWGGQADTWKVPTGEGLSALSARLDSLEPRIQHYLWIEQPYVQVALRQTKLR